MSRPRKDYVRQEIVRETQDIAEASDALDVQIPGPCPVPKNLRTAIEYVAFTAAKGVKLKNGQTALFWHLLSIVQSHMGEK